jgi:ArsR family transcriptional regulator, arsenate/arsenite/antimonite-responsive transcriptional repressor
MIFLQHIDDDRCLRVLQSTLTYVNIYPMEKIAVLECCAPLLTEPLSAEAAQELGELLKVLADAARLRILSIIAAHDEKEACVCEFPEPLGLSQPTVSHHLKVLQQAGFLAR